jgi:hypothetical protein
MTRSELTHLSESRSDIERITPELLNGGNMRRTIIALAMASSATLAAESIAPVFVPPLSPKYISAFDGYRTFKDEPLGSWHDANTEMGKLGGHTGNLGMAEPARTNASGTTLKDTPSPVTPSTASGVRK